MAKTFIDKSSKLAGITSGAAPKNVPLGLVTKAQPSLQPKSFRLRPDDLERLSGIVAKLNEQCPGRTVTEVDVIRGLLVMGTKATPERLIEAIREALL
jgi:hypothetical protein